MLLMTVAAAVIWNTLIPFKFFSFHTEISWYRRNSLQICMWIMAVWVHVRLQCKCTKTISELQYFMHYVHLCSKCTLSSSKNHVCFIGFPKQGVHGWLKYTWYMIKYGSDHTYYSVRTSYSAHLSPVQMMSQLLLSLHRAFWNLYIVHSPTNALFITLGKV